MKKTLSFIFLNFALLSLFAQTEGVLMDCPSFTFPYTETFEEYGTSDVVRECWLNLGNNDAYPCMSTFKADNSEHSVYFNSYNGNNLSAIQIDGSFSMAASELVFSAYSPATGSHIIVGVLNNPNMPSTFVPVDTITPHSVGHWERFAISLSRYVGTSNYLCFRSAGFNEIYLDNIALRLPQCEQVLPAYENYEHFALGTNDCWTNVTNNSLPVIEYDPIDTTLSFNYTYSYRLDSVYRQDSFFTTSSVSQSFSYTGSVQTYNALPGTYTLEVWGAQGGNGGFSSTSPSYAGGLGGYSVGTLTLTTSTTLYVYVGGQGTYSTTSGWVLTYGGWNGGGSARRYNYAVGSGGGATDIRLVYSTCTLNGTTYRYETSSNSLLSRIIVAGGGGGTGGGGSGGYSYVSSYGNYGGGLVSGGASDACTGTVQPAQNNVYIGGRAGQTYAGNAMYYSGYDGSSIAGEFGYGGTYYSTHSSNTAASGGGAGWYGGGVNCHSAGGGGSGYVYTASTASNYPSGCQLNSSYYLTDAYTTAGNQSFPSTTGSYETGHSGDGYAKITGSGSVLDHTETVFDHIDTIYDNIIIDTILTYHSHSLLIEPAVSDPSIVVSPKLEVVEDLQLNTLSFGIFCDADELIEVGMMTDPNSAASFYPIATAQAVAHTWQHVTCYGISNDLMGNHLAFKSTSSLPVYIDNLDFLDAGFPEPIDSTGIREIANASCTLNIIPNPAQNYIEIQSTENEQDNVDIEIYNLFGTLVKKCSAGTRKINVADLANGAYIVRMGTQKGKFIKQ